MNLFTLFNVAVLQVVLLFFWFNDYFVSFLSNFDVFLKHLRYEEFLRLKKVNKFLNYPSFIVFNKNNFFTKPLNCPVCLNFWMTGLFCFCFYLSGWQFMPTIYVFSLILFLCLEKLTQR